VLKFCSGIVYGERRKITFKIFENRRHSCTGRTVRCNEFVVNILEGAIFGEKAIGRPQLQYLSKSAETQQLTVIQQ